MIHSSVIGRINFSLIKVKRILSNFLFNFYTTNFPLIENPITENGMWMNGKNTVINWSNYVTTSIP